MSLNKCSQIFFIQNYFHKVRTLTYLWSQSILFRYWTVSKVCTSPHFQLLPPNLLPWSDIKIFKECGTKTIHSSPKETQLFLSCLSFGEECRSVKFGPNIIFTMLLVPIWGLLLVTPRSISLGCHDPGKNPEIKVAFLLGKSVVFSYFQIYTDSSQECQHIYNSSLLVLLHTVLF